MSLSKLQEMVKDREVWHAAACGITKIRTRLKRLSSSSSTYIFFFPCLDQQIYRQSQPFIYAASTNHGSKIFEKKIPESSIKQNLNLLHAGNYLNSIYIVLITIHRASQVALVVQNSPANARDIRDTGSIPRSGRSPGGGHGNLLQYSSLENPMDREAWQATVHRVAQSQTRLKQLSTQYTLLFTPHVHCIRYYD